METPGIIACVILAAIIIGALVTALRKGKIPSSSGSSDTENGNGDLGGGLGKNK